MDWRECVADGVPEDPTPGPEALRSDIADELNDHLSCAMQRELRRTDDESEAEDAVLERFGDPRQVARQLWWDAVKERVMRDRILLVAVAIITLASLLVSVAALRAVQQGQQVNQAVLAKIAELPINATTPELTGDWSMAVIRAVNDDAKPMEGIAVQLRGHLFNATDVGELNAKTDKDGVATIGPIKAGQYEFKAWANGHYAQYQDFAFFPGRKKEFTIVAPRAESATARASFQVNSPEELDTSDLVLEIFISRADTVTLGSWKWVVQGATTRFLGLDGRILNLARNPDDTYSVDVAAETHEATLLPPGDYRINGWRLYVVAPDDHSGNTRQLIGILDDYTPSWASFKAISGEESRVQLDVTKQSPRHSLSRKSLQEQKEAALTEFAAKKKTSQ